MEERKRKSLEIYKKKLEHVSLYERKALVYIIDRED